jgi:metallophosphoesterase superfamily enzyme
MQHLILTDAHVGYKDINLPEVYDKIKEQHNFKQIITLGDMIDLWRTNIDNVLIEQEDNIDFLKKKCRNVIGNHDFIMPKTTKIKYYEEYNLEGYTFIHGHQFEAMTSELPFSTQEDYEKIANRMCYCSKFISNVLNKIYNFNNIGSNSHKK